MTTREEYDEAWNCFKDWAACGDATTPDYIECESTIELYVFHLEAEIERLKAERDAYAQEVWDAAREEVWSYLSHRFIHEYKNLEDWQRSREKMINEGPYWAIISKEGEVSVTFLSVEGCETAEQALDYFKYRILTSKDTPFNRGLEYRCVKVKIIEVEE